MKLLGSTALFLYLENCELFTQVQEIRPQKPAGARFRDTYPLTSGKSVCTEPKARPFR